MSEAVGTPIKALCCSPVLSGALPVKESQDLATALKVLADPVRLRLLGLVRTSPGGEARTNDLVEPLGVTQPTVSYHLGALFEAGFVRRERRGRETWYAIEPDSFSALRQVLDPRPA